MLPPEEGLESGTALTRAELLELVSELKKVRAGMIALAASVELTPFRGRERSAANLLHYIALRSQDMRRIQESLSIMGTSSLGRSESHVLFNLDAVIALLQGLAHEPLDPVGGGAIVSPSEGAKTLERNAEALFGPKQEGRRGRIMVTAPSEAATDYYLVKELVEAGMDILRINCAHDSEREWSGMLENLRKAEKEVGRKCRVLMDIGGPKLRTGELEPGPQVLRLKPSKDHFGRVTAPAKVVLTANEGEPGEAADTGYPVMVMPRSWVAGLDVGSRVTLKDARGSRRELVVTRKEAGAAMAEAWKTVYVTPATKLWTEIRGKPSAGRPRGIPHLEQPILLKKGDSLVVTGRRVRGSNAAGEEPARVPCTLPGALRFVKRGDRIWFDDGRVGGVVKSASKKELLVEVTNVGTEGARLRADKGINLPDSELKLPPLMPRDMLDLKFIADHADMVGYSFVRTPQDLRTLREHLRRVGRGDVGVVLKIETQKAFDQLPGLLLESLKGPLSAVMIARGDLAVECGFERLAEVQEEILWLTEAAHMPAIWATQVLEEMTKSGVPSRAEVTDAAEGERAECVMLNKGPHAVEALKALDSILRRMQAHQVKKQSMMRQLNIASNFVGS